MKAPAIFALLTLLIGASAAANVALFDSKDAAYLLPGSQAVPLQQSQLSSIIAAITGLLPDAAIGEQLSSLLGAVVRPSALRKPKALAVLNIGGLNSDSAAVIFKGRQHRAVDVQGSGCLFSATIDSLARIAGANPSVPLIMLDHNGLQNCQDDCLQQHLEVAASLCKAKLQAGEQTAGTLTLANGAALDLSQAEDRMFAVELSSVSAGLKAQLEALQQRAELKGAQEDVEVYEVNVMGLHALAHKYGKDSLVAQGAQAAVAELLQWAVEQLDAAYSGDVIYQVTLSSQAPAAGMKALGSWKEQTRRQLLQAATSWPPADEAEAARQFSAKAAGYGSFIIILYFCLAAMHCMCNMPFKVDTLLFPGQKKDQ